MNTSREILKNEFTYKVIIASHWTSILVLRNFISSSFLFFNNANLCPVFCIFQRKHPAISLEVSSSASDSPAKEQPSISSFASSTKRWGSTDPRQLQTDQALVFLVAGNLLPLSLVDSIHFRRFCEAGMPGYQVPCRRTLINKLIKERHALLHNKVEHLAKSAQSICLTIDLWTNRQMKSFIGITGHMLINYSLHSVLFACNRVKGRHTAANILSHYEEVVASFNIGHKIAAVITDNASNMVAAFSLPGFQHEDSSDNSEDNTDSDIEDTDSDNIVDTDSVLEYLPTTHERCLPHTLQLIVKDGLAEATQMKKTITKASTIARKLRKSGIATDTLEHGPRVQTACPTRWNSEVKMIRSVLAQDSTKLDQLDNIPQLSQHERNILQDLLDTLQPFEDATDKLQGQDDVTASMVIPCIIGLRESLKTPSRYNGKLTAALSASLEKRMPAFESKTSYKLASVLDPRFKLRWLPSAQAKEAIKEELITALASTATPKPPSSPSISPPAKRPRLFQFMEEEDNTAPADTPQEVQEYLGEKSLPYQANPLQYWQTNEHRFPQLAKLAQFYLAIPASSAPVERIFSTAGKIFTPERACLADSNFEALMFIKCNDALYTN